MAVQLFAHPFSSYSQRVLVALYENAIPFDLRLLDGASPDNLAEWSRHWPLQRFPVLVDGTRTLREASIIIEYLQLAHPGPVTLIPHDPRDALDVRWLDRFFDNYISTPQQAVVFSSLRPASDRDVFGERQARERLELAYDWLEQHLHDGRTWAAGEAFSLADCGAAPFLFYAHWTQPIAPRFARVHAYRQRLLARPSFKRAVDEARPYRHLFPLDVPEQD